jgi:hypothetical protein
LRLMGAVAMLSHFTVDLSTMQANETIALPLCNEALNYCTLTSLVDPEERNTLLHN